MTKIKTSHRVEIEERRLPAAFFYDLLSKSQSNVVWEILRQSGKFYEWNHYPDSDVYDRETHSQYYFHSHPAASGERWQEHGHFHLFIRNAGMPNNCKPKPLLAIQQGVKTDDLCHIIGVSMDRMGKPVRLFTTNRWVTGETWYDAETVCQLVELYSVNHAFPSWPTNLWLNALVYEHRELIKKLVHERDEVIERWQAKFPNQNVFEDRQLEVASSAEIAVN